MKYVMVTIVAVKRVTLVVEGGVAKTVGSNWGGRIKMWWWVG